MKWIEKLTNWNLASLKINMRFAEMEFVYTDADEKAAWEMYVEIITRVLSRTSHFELGDERAALQSVYSLFQTTRDLLKLYGRDYSLERVSEKRILVPAFLYDRKVFRTSRERTAVER